MRGSPPFETLLGSMCFGYGPLHLTVASASHILFARIAPDFPAVDPCDFDPNEPFGTHRTFNPSTLPFFLMSPAI